LNPYIIILILFLVGAKVTTYYNPAQPEQATLEPGPGRDDWFIFILGIVVTIIGVGFLIFSG
jgi:hypothetical protein